MDILGDSILSELAVESSVGSIITVVGIGGAGGNAVNYMWDIGIRNVEFLVCNTDQLVLDNSPISNKIRLGDDGLGAGNDPEKGRSAALASLDLVREQLIALNTRMLFITAGMGGGTGTGAAPVVAKLARELGILTVAIVTSPLLVEGELRYNQAMKGIDELRECVDSLLIINNENIQKIYLEKNATAYEAFSKANEILSYAAKGISEIITVQSTFIHVDFADVSKVMRDSGRAHMSVEKASGENRASIVAKNSLSSPLLNHNHITGAKDILLNIAVAKLEDLQFTEVNDILNYIQNNARVVTMSGEVRTANIIWGMSVKPYLEDALELVMVSTGFDDVTDGDYSDFSNKLSMLFSDPNSPIVRLNAGQKTNDNSEGVTTKVRRGIIRDGDKIILPERERRYPNIASFLKNPAYKARLAQMIEETPAESSAQ